MDEAKQMQIKKLKALREDLLFQIESIDKQLAEFEGVQVEEVVLPDKRRKTNNIKHNAKLFEKFWKLYPRKANKQQAVNMWNRLAEKQFGDLRMILTDVGFGVTAYIDYIKRNEIDLPFVQHASTFLNPENKNYLKENWETKKT